MDNDKTNDQAERNRAKVAQITAAALREVSENMPMLLEQFALTAKLHKAKFDALVKAGFNAEQALELCKTL